MLDHTKDLFKTKDPKKLTRSELRKPAGVLVLAGIGVLLNAALIGIPVDGNAQVLPVPARPRPGPPAELPKPPPEPTAPIEVEPLGGEAPPGASGIFLVFRGIEFAGATVYSADDLKQLYLEMIGQRISLAQLFSIAERIQDHYHSEGYVLTRVIVPPQSVDDGIFRFRVVEGFIGDIQIDGDIGPVRARLMDYLENLLGEAPVTQQALERYLLLANDIPGIRALGLLRSASGEAGASRLIVQADRTPFYGYAFVNNRGSRYTGPSRFSLLARENSATFLGEQIEGIFLNTLFTTEQQYGQLTYRQILGGDGLRLDLTASYGPSEPGFDLSSLDIDTLVMLAGGTLSYPIIRSRTRNLYINGGFEAINQDVDFGSLNVNRDRVRVFFANIAYDLQSDFAGYSTLSLGLRQGVNGLGASQAGESDLSRPDGIPDFTSLNIQTSHLQQIRENLAIYIAAVGQYSFDTLLNIEEFKTGGEPFGRGYNPAELSGDSGIAGTAELRYTLPVPLRYWRSVQGYGFYDFGVVWNRDSFADPETSLTSTGFGVRNQLFEDWFIDLEVAWPLTRIPDTFTKDPRFFFQVLARY